MMPRTVLNTTKTTKKARVSAHTQMQTANKECRGECMSLSKERNSSILFISLNREEIDERNIKKQVLWHEKKNGLKHCLISNISVCFSFSFIATSFARTFALFFFSICSFFDTKRWTAKPLKISWIRTKKINEKKKRIERNTRDSRTTAFHIENNLCCVLQEIGKDDRHTRKKKYINWSTLQRGISKQRTLEPYARVRDIHNYNENQF